MKRFLALSICFVMLLGLFPFGVFAESEITEFITITPDVEFPENEELFAGYVEKTFYPETAFATWGRSARDMLSDNDKYMYDWLKSNIIKIANGQQTNAKFTGDIASWSGVTKNFSSNHINNFYAQFDHQNIIEALLQDCPYELYWFDKSTGYRLGASRLGNNITQVMAIMSVSVGYRANNYNSDDPKVSSGTMISTALANAQAVVNSNASKNDFDKLIAYRDKICELTDYNFDVLEAVDPDYGDPWQLIHVFDGVSSTKVVCEGYSKAFKYLCDKSTFEHSNISCYSVVGTSNGGGHMWNIVTMDDGKNYMVDVTNSDSGAIGQNGGLFLSGMTGSVSSGYSKTLSRNMTYIYSDDTKWLWGTDSESILNLSSTDYDPYFPTITISNGEIVYDGSNVTAGKSDSDLIYTVNSKAGNSGYNVTIEWYDDDDGKLGNKLSGAPKNIGDYWVKITAKHGTYNSSNYATKKFTITPAILDIVSASCMDKEYDGSTSAPVDYISLQGVCDVDVIIATADANFLSADVGAKNKVKLTNITLSGTQAGNYKMGSDEYIVDVVGVFIEKQHGASAPSIQISYAESTQYVDRFVATVTAVKGAEYRMDDGEWQDSNLFDNIAPGSAHTFYARIKETETTFAGEIGASELVNFVKLEATDIPLIQAEVSGESGNRTITLISDGNVEYSFDNGLTWTDNNVLTGVTDDKVDCAARFKETATVNASGMATLQVDTKKISQPAPESFEVEVVLNPDGKTFTITAPLMENGLYSFDGINFSADNVKTDCEPETEIKVYVKFAETDEFGESIATVVSITTPSAIIKGDVNENGIIDSMDYVLLKRAYFGTFILKKTEIGDINNNQTIDSMDYVYLRRAYFGTYVIK